MRRLLALALLTCLCSSCGIVRRIEGPSLTAHSDIMLNGTTPMRCPCEHTEGKHWTCYDADGFAFWQTDSLVSR